MSPARRGLLAKVHIARKELCLQEDSYRSLVERVTGRDSAGSCTDAQLELLLTEFRRLGFKAQPARSMSHKPNVRMIYAIWADLKPFVKSEGKEALRAFVRRQTGKEVPEFLTAPEVNKVVEGLKAWLKRERIKAGEQAMRELSP